jgi:FAD/FMN-containing dehydrogenase
MTLFTPLRDQLGADVFQIPGEFDPARHVHDFLVGSPEGTQILGVAYPRSTAEVSEVLRFCNSHDIKVTPQGGMTGLAGGGVPVGQTVVLSLERMRAIEEIDVAAGTITVQAGIPLEGVQIAADEAGLFFPLDLGGRGTAQVGGNASTNAGGNRVVRYGMMRQLVLGMEWVMADGTVVTSLNKMIKNNAGYDLKQLFIGSEGTLGVITRLVLRLFPKALSVQTGLCALADYKGVLDLLARAKGGLGATLSAFEMMWPEFYHLGTEALGRRPPIPAEHGVYVLIETMGDDPEADQARFEEVIGGAIEAGTVADAVIAKSGQEAKALWSIRDAPGEFSKVFWPQISFDISIPTGQMGDFMVECRNRLQARWPEIRTVFFGHVADSNLHLSVKSDGDSKLEHEIDGEVYKAVGDWGGSISAEHGIGVHKKPFLHYSRTPEEVALMRQLKAALDPKGTLNPGKVF